MSSSQEHWITRLAAKEMARRKTVDELSKEMPRFLETLAAALNSNIRKYEQIFGESAEVFAAVADATMEVVAKGPTPAPKATIMVDPTEQTIRCSFENVERAQDWEKNLFTDPSVGLKNQPIEASAEGLAELILAPVLFPVLSPWR